MLAPQLWAEVPDDLIPREALDKRVSTRIGACGPTTVGLGISHMDPEGSLGLRVSRLQRLGTGVPDGAGDCVSASLLNLDCMISLDDPGILCAGCDAERGAASGPPAERQVTGRHVEPALVQAQRRLAKLALSFDGATAATTARAGTTCVTS
jgi:hypothetical protein